MSCINHLQWLYVSFVITSWIYHVQMVMLEAIHCATIYASCSSDQPYRLNMVKVRSSFVVRIKCQLGRHNVGHLPTMSTLHFQQTQFTSYVWLINVCTPWKRRCLFHCCSGCCLSSPCLCCFDPGSLKFCQKGVLYSGEVCCIHKCFKCFDLCNILNH